MKERIAALRSAIGIRMNLGRPCSIASLASRLKVNEVTIYRWTGKTALTNLPSESNLIAIGELESKYGIGKKP